MTFISYECVGSDGEKLITKSLREADNFVARHGGTYTLVEKRVESDSADYVRANHRKIGDKGGK